VKLVDVDLSPRPEERDLQVCALGLVGAAIVLVVGVSAMRVWGGLSDSATTLVGTLGGVAWGVAALWAPLLVRRHREAIRTVYGLRSPYRNLGLVVALMSLLSAVVFLWGAAFGVLVGAVTVLLVQRIPPVDRAGASAVSTWAIDPEGL